MNKKLGDLIVWLNKEIKQLTKFQKTTIEDSKLNAVFDTKIEAYKKVLERL